MSQCPACGNTIHEDFGLVNCSQCGAVLVVDLDGTVRMNDPEPEESPPPIEGAEDIETPSIPESSMVFSDAEDTFGEPMDSSSEGLAEEDADAFSDPHMDPGLVSPEESSSIPQEPELTGEESFVAEGEDFSSGSEPAAVSDFVVEDGPSFKSESDVDLGDIDAQVNPPVDVPEPEPVSASLSGIAEFGNSDLSSGSDGLLFFNIFIDGIDTGDIRDAVKEVLEDQRYMWNVDELMRGLENGRMRIEKVSSVKASMFIHHLKGLPIDISWEQHAITEA